MKNVNYDLLKMLHSKCDNIWRLEKFYVNDAKKARCKSKAVFEKVLADEKKHYNMLLAEVERKVKGKRFN